MNTEKLQPELVITPAQRRLNEMFAQALMLAEHVETSRLILEEHARRFPEK